MPCLKQTISTWIIETWFLNLCNSNIKTRTVTKNWFRWVNKVLIVHSFKLNKAGWLHKSNIFSLISKYLKSWLLAIFFLIFGIICAFFLKNVISKYHSHETLEFDFISKHFEKWHHQSKIYHVCSALFARMNSELRKNKDYEILPVTTPKTLNEPQNVIWRSSNYCY